MHRLARWFLPALGAMVLLAACGQPASPPAPVDAGPAAPATAPGTEASPPAADAGVTPLLDLETEQFLQLSEPWRGDWDAVTSGERRFLRVLVPYNRTLYFLSGAEQQGIAFESLREFEQTLVRQVPKGRVPPKIVIVPTPRNRLLPALAEGYGDIAIGGLTVTAARAQDVAFSLPTMDNVRELVVTAPGEPPVNSLADLAGREIHVRSSSSYRESLAATAERLQASGLEPLRVVATDEMLETEDLLQLVDAGILPATVADAHIARAWAGLFDRMVINDAVTLREGGTLAWAVRKDAPRLLEVVNGFVKGHREGTLFGNVLIKRYLDPAAKLRNPRSEGDARKFREIIGHLRRYAGDYDFDWLLVGAQAYQESQLDNNLRSAAGAVGVMQVKPSTARDMGINDIRPVDRNIEAGVKYLRFMSDRYFNDGKVDPLNRQLFAIAAYNAGPAKVARLRTEAATRGLDPDVWFGNVEVVAARRIGRETVDYVSNIYKYYVAYKALVAADSARRALPQVPTGPT
jgi:membrane-bound lytic murein transglycosylase MltF